MEASEQPLSSDPGHRVNQALFTRISCNGTYFNFLRFLEIGPLDLWIMVLKVVRVRRDCILQILPNAFANAFLSLLRIPQIIEVIQTKRGATGRTFNARRGLRTSVFKV